MNVQIIGCLPQGIDEKTTYWATDQDGSRGGLVNEPALATRYNERTLPAALKAAFAQLKGRVLMPVPCSPWRWVEINPELWALEQQIVTHGEYIPTNGLELVFSWMVIGTVRDGRDDLWYGYNCDQWQIGPSPNLDSAKRQLVGFMLSTFRLAGMTVITEGDM